MQSIWAREELIPFSRTANKATEKLNLCLNGLLA